MLVHRDDDTTETWPGFGDGYGGGGLSNDELADALAQTSPAMRIPVAPPDPDEALVGQWIGSFKIVRKLGRGGMGTVYLAEQGMIGSKVAVKFLHPDLAADPRLVARFHSEARVVNLIGHENIVSIFDLGVLGSGMPYLLMEYLEGRPLSELRGPQPLEVMVPILTQVCDALAAAHRREIVHRDLKPANIHLIQRSGREDFVKLLDFGVARLGTGSAATSAGSILGTPEYMSPEQSLGSAQVDGRSDVYSLGVIAYQLATGQLPFIGSPAVVLAAHRELPPPSARALRPELPRALVDVLHKALAKSPAERFQTVEAFKAALVEAASPRPPAGPRRDAEVRARFLDTAGRELGHFRCVELSRGGLFACAEGPLPALFSKLVLVLPEEEGGESCAVEVVGHMRGAEPGRAGMAPGFGVRFVQPSRAFREAIGRRLS